MIISERGELIALLNSTCRAAAKVKNACSELGHDEAFPMKVVLGRSAKNGRWPIYLIEETPANLIALIESAVIDGRKLDAADYSALADANCYEIALIGPQCQDPDGKKFTGELRILKEETSANRATAGETDEKVRKAADAAIAAGCVTAEEMEERIRLMKENGVDPFLMYRVVSQYRKYNKPTHRPSTIYVDPYLESSMKSKREGIIAEGLRAAVSRQALICEGEKSVGKNVYLETIAWLMNQPQYLITFSRQMSPASIYGEKSTDNSAAKALAEFDPNILQQADRIEEKIRFSMNILFKQGMGANDAMDSAMKMLPETDRNILRQAAEFKKLQAQSASVNIIIDASELYDWLADGGMMVFNEMNLCEPNFLASFANQLLDGTGFLFIPGRGEVPIHKDCVLFGTQNADYAGCEQQNEATVSRFGCLVFPQPESIKRQLVSAVTSALKRDGFSGAALNLKYYDQCENFYIKLRAAVRKAQVTNACLNIRGFVRALTAVAESDGKANLKRQIEIHVVNTTSQEDRSAILPILSEIVTL